MQRTIVRCSRGALYSTIWNPWGSLKAIRLGPVRIQRCPVHHRWEKTRRVDPGALTPRQLEQARSTIDTRIP